MLPTSVLKTAQSEMLDWHGAGMSIMEVSHRSSMFTQVIMETEQLLRELMQIPDHYRVLFLQGGASLQFSMIPLNLMNNRPCDLVNTGYWSIKARQEMSRFGRVREIASGESSQFWSIPAESEWERHDDAAYLYFTSNETISGAQFAILPHPQGNVPLVCDMSSDILSRDINVDDFGLIFAGAQKNLGIAGLAIIIIREDLLDRSNPDAPTLLKYRTQADSCSLYNTPPAYAIYMTSLVLDWLKAQGGVKAIEKLNQEKAALLYQCLDDCNEFYHAPVKPDCRSKMNVVFYLRNKTLDDTFIKEGKLQGLFNLRGHKVLGGMRASLYNAMPLAGVKVLTTFMRDFAQKYG